MKKIFAVCLAAVLLLLASGCIEQKPITSGGTDTNCTIDINNADCNYGNDKTPPDQSAGIFCEKKFPQYIYSEEEYSTFTGQQVKLKTWSKETEDKAYNYVEGTVQSESVIESYKQWNTNDKKTGEYSTTHLIVEDIYGRAGTCTSESNIVDMEKLWFDKIYDERLGTEKRTIAGKECTMLKEPITHKIGEIYDIYDCINKEYCTTLRTILVDSEFGQTEIMLTKISDGLFSDSIFTPPSNCTEYQPDAGNSDLQNCIEDCEAINSTDGYQRDCAFVCLSD